MSTCTSAWSSELAVYSMAGCDFKSPLAAVTWTLAAVRRSAQSFGAAMGAARGAAQGGGGRLAAAEQEWNGGAAAGPT